MVCVENGLEVIQAFGWMPDIVNDVSDFVQHLMGNIKTVQDLM